MIHKRPFLLIIVLLSNISCTVAVSQQGIHNPPSDFFVKVYKSLIITRCAKTVKPGKKKCETAQFNSSGSGLVILLPSKKRIVLSSGHVCRSDDIVEEDEFFKYKWTETVRLLDRNQKFHDGHVIKVTQAGNKSSDLCSLFVPSLDYFKKKSKIKISNKPPKVGEEVYYIGAPLGIYHAPTALIVKGIFSGNINQYTSLTSIPAAPGASGSVIMSIDNRVYGVLFAVHPNFPNASIITSFEETKKFILESEKLLD